jgi:hypothetical protein
LHEACTNGDVDTVRVLLAHGADPLAPDARGQTPRDRAAAHNRKKVLALLDAGEKPSRPPSRSAAVPPNPEPKSTRSKRATGEGSIVHEPGLGTLEVFALPTDRAAIEGTIRYLFERWWASIRFGPLVAGAVFEARCTSKPKIRRVDGFLTIELGDWYFSVAVAPCTRATTRSDEAARAPRRAELYRLLDGDRPVSWAFRMYNGEGQQTLSVTLPNPYLDDELRRVAHPDWKRLAAWDHLRKRYLGLGPDPADRGVTAPPPHGGDGDR